MSGYKKHLADAKAFEARDDEHFVSEQDPFGDEKSN